MREALDAQLDYHVAMSVKPAVLNYKSSAEEKRVYYPEIEVLVAKVTGDRVGEVQLIVYGPE